MTAFPATRGSVIVAAASGEPVIRARALETLAAAYWKPVYAYIRMRHGKSHEEASDLTQELFARLVEKGWLLRFDPAKARLRTYLRVCVDGLVANEEKAARREKRGGGVAILSLDVAASRDELELALSAGGTPEQAFEKQWVKSVFALALERFRAEARASGKTLGAALFSAYDLGEDEPRPSYADLAARHGTTAVDVTNKLAAARRDFRRAVLDVLRELTANESELRLEARALLGIELP